MPIKYTIKFETEYCWKTFKEKYELTNCPTNPLLIRSMDFTTKDLTLRNKPFSNKKIEQGHSQGLPRFSKEKGSYLEFDLLFANEQEAQDFIQDNDIFKKVKDKSFWFTLRQARYKGCYYTSDNPEYPTVPIYIPSKGRWNYCSTAHSLLEMGIDNFHIIVEEQEYTEYARVFDTRNLLILPNEFFTSFEGEPTLDKSLMGCGSPPARNFAWSHSIESGHSHHMILDK